MCAIHVFDVTCAGCGLGFVAKIFPPRPPQRSKLILYDGTDAQGNPLEITRCPNCGRDFPKLTPEEFKRQIAF